MTWEIIVLTYVLTTPQQTKNKKTQTKSCQNFEFTPYPPKKTVAKELGGIPIQFTYPQRNTLMSSANSLDTVVEEISTPMATMPQQLGGGPFPYHGLNIYAPQRTRFNFPEDVKE